MHKRFVRLLLGAALTAAVAYVLMVHMDKVRANVSQRDFIQYWAAGKLLIHRDNPYDCESTIELEWQHGYAQDRPVLFRTPVVVAVSVLAVGTSECFWGWLLWMAVSVASLILAMRLS